MNWRWISLTALLAAFVIGYGALNGRMEAPIRPGEPPVQPGYYLNDAVITETQKDGSLGIQLSATRIVQQPSDDSIAVSDVRVNYFQASGRQWLLTSKRGFVPADSRIVRFEGDVVLRPADSPASFLRTQTMTIDTERNLAYGVDSPVTMKFGEHTLTVQNFTADLKSEKLRLESVNGRFESP